MHPSTTAAVALLKALDGKVNEIAVSINDRANVELTMSPKAAGALAELVTQKPESQAMGALMYIADTLGLSADALDNLAELGQKVREVVEKAREHETLKTVADDSANMIVEIMSILTEEDDLPNASRDTTPQRLRGILSGRRILANRHGSITLTTRAYPANSPSPDKKVRAVRRIEDVQSGQDVMWVRRDSEDWFPLTSGETFGPAPVTWKVVNCVTVVDTSAERRYYAHAHHFGEHFEEMEWVVRDRDQQEKDHADLTVSRFGDNERAAIECARRYNERALPEALR